MQVNAGLLADSLGWALLHSIWQIALIAGLAAIVLRLVPRHHAQLRYLMAYGGLVAALFAFIATWGISYRVIASTAPATGTYIPPVEGLPALIEMLGQTTWFVSLAWALGFGWLGVRYVQALRATNRLRREGVSAVPSEWEERFRLWVERLGADRAARIFQSSRITTPLTIGTLKPIVLVPTGFFLRLPMDQAEAILVHEIAHICRQDYLLGLVQAMICNIFFFHPAIGWLSRQIDIEREFACDARVVRETGGTQALAQGLSKVALESRDMLPGFAMAANGDRSPIMDRITRLREKPFRRESGTTIPAAALTLVFAACLTIAVSADASFEGAGAKADEEKDSSRLAHSSPTLESEAIATAREEQDASAPAERSSEAEQRHESASRRDKDHGERTGNHEERGSAERASPARTDGIWSISYSPPQFSVPKTVNRAAWQVARETTPSLLHSAVYQPDSTSFQSAASDDDNDCEETRREEAERRRERELERAEARREREMARIEALRERAEAQLEREEAIRERELARLEARLEREAEAREAEFDRMMEDLEERLTATDSIVSAETHRAIERARRATVRARSRAESVRTRQRESVPAVPEAPAPVITISFVFPDGQGVFRFDPNG